MRNLYIACAWGASEGNLDKWRWLFANNAQTSVIWSSLFWDFQKYPRFGHSSQAGLCSCTCKSMAWRLRPFAPTRFFDTQNIVKSSHVHITADSLKSILNILGCVSSKSKPFSHFAPARLPGPATFLASKSCELPYFLRLYKSYWPHCITFLIWFAQKRNLTSFKTQKNKRI